MLSTGSPTGGIDTKPTPVTLLPRPDHIAEPVTITIAAPTEWIAPSKPLYPTPLPTVADTDLFELHGVCLAD